MDNDGPSQPLSSRAPFGYNATSDGWTQRNLLARAESLADVRSIIAARAASTGGTCIAGCNIMISQPYAAASAAIVYEGDRMSGAYRLPNSSPPYTRSSSVIAVTNHYLNYGFDPAFPYRNFGVDILSPSAPGGDLSTIWRYAAVSAAIVARDDAAASVDGSTRGCLTFEHIRSMLQGTPHSHLTIQILTLYAFAFILTPKPPSNHEHPSSNSQSTIFLTHLASASCHGSTEHSIITRAHLGQPGGDMWLAVADMRTVAWNAPYAPYTLFTWRELFP
jgi:hypothetical protein